MIALLGLGVIFSFLNLISPWLVVGLLLGYLIFLLIVSTTVKLNFFVRSHNSNPQVLDRKIAITFDDGPVENTKEILKSS